MQPAEFLSYATVRIEGTTSTGDTVTGTGFLFRLCEHDGQHVPVLFTNRHVIQDTTKTRLFFCATDADGKALDTQLLRFDGPGAAHGWVFHPNPDIDLCCLPVAMIFAAYEKLGHRCFVTSLDKTLLPDDALLAEIDGGEDVVMVGYPNGIWDSQHNKPLIRRGITATHPKRDYNGKPEFLIDCACFPGSSGSPVLLYNRGSYATQKGLQAGNRVKLLGVLYAGPQHTTEGDIVVVTIPTLQVPKAVGTIPNHLGYVLKSRLLLDFEPLFQKSGNA